MNEKTLKKGTRLVCRKFDFCRKHEQMVVTLTMVTREGIAKRRVGVGSKVIGRIAKLVDGSLGKESPALSI